MYRGNFRARLQGRDESSAQTGIPWAHTLQTETSEVESALRIKRLSSYPVQYDDKLFSEDRFFAADSNFFQFFSFKLVAGNPSEALKGVGKIVITESTAKKYFDYKGAGDLRPLGENSYSRKRRASKQRRLPVSLKTHRATVIFILISYGPLNPGRI
ncbi:MAG: ABC transporter permease [Bacteroidota bacterium]